MKISSPSLFDHLKAILALPFFVIIVIPTFIHLSVDKPFLNLFHLVSPIWILIFGMISIGIGLFLMIKTIGLFNQKGKGTLAPWDPPRKLVVVGPYRYVRNPMIAGVNFILMGLSFVLKDENILLWMVFFLSLNTFYFIIKEEPDLAKRFGDDYLNYKENVPRWIPRITPWDLVKK